MSLSLDEGTKASVGVYEEEKNMGIRSRCEGAGLVYAPERIVLLYDNDGNELYYYKTDAGNLFPIVAIGEPDISFHYEDDQFYRNEVTVTVKQKELHPDIFKPRPNV